MGKPDLLAMLLLVTVLGGCMSFTRYLEHRVDDDWARLAEVEKQVRKVEPGLLMLEEYIERERQLDRDLRLCRRLLEVRQRNLATLRQP